MHQRRRFPSLPIKHRRERGTTAVEFALIFPILFVLIFGIVEIGWTLEQEHGVQSSAQAVAREAAINFAEAEVTDMDATISAICAELNLQTDAEVTVELPDGTAPGDTVLVTITEDLEQATGMFGPLLNGKTVTGQAAARLEQEAAYTGVATQQCDGTVVATPTPAPSPTPTSTPMPGPTPTPTPVPTATPVPAGTPTPAPTETPTPTPSCTVPDFDNVRKNNATTLWTSAGFSGSITFQSGSGNYRIHYQSLSASANASCDSIIEVGP